MVAGSERPQWKWKKQESQRLSCEEPAGLLTFGAHKQRQQGSAEVFRLSHWLDRGPFPEVGKRLGKWVFEEKSLIQSGIH